MRARQNGGGGYGVFEGIPQMLQRATEKTGLA